MERWPILSKVREQWKSTFKCKYGENNKFSYLWPSYWGGRIIIQYNTICRAHYVKAEAVFLIQIRHTGVRDATISIYTHTASSLDLLINLIRDNIHWYDGGWCNDEAAIAETSVLCKRGLQYPAISHCDHGHTLSHLIRNTPVVLSRWFISASEFHGHFILGVTLVHHLDKFIFGYQIILNSGKIIKTISWHH